MDETRDAQLAETMAALGQLEEQCRKDVGWFFLIAGLSVVNSVLWFFESEWVFAVGLGITQLFHGIVLGFTEGATDSAQTTGQVISLAFGLIVSGVVALFGVVGRKMIGWLYLSGVILYCLDGVLLLLFQDFLGVAIHVLAVVYMIRGYLAFGKLEAATAALAAAVAAAAATPPPEPAV